VEGPHAVGDALAAGVEIVRVFHTPDDAEGRMAAARCGADALVVTPEVLAKVSTTQTPQSPVAVVAVPDAPLPGSGDVLVAWGVGDPGNVGTLIRAAAAFGLSFAAGPGCADPWSAKVLRSAAGGHFRAPVREITELRDLGDSTVVATVPSGGEPPSQLPDGRLAILVGDEAAGLPGEVVAQAAMHVTIPMPGGTESLNAAVAGAIVAYEASRRGGVGRVTANH
jgi:TrmH family RNA methyltransferase